MAEERTTKREVKLRRNNEFDYEGSLNFLTSRSSSINIRRELRHTSSDSEAPSVVTNTNLEGTANNIWSNINFLPSVLPSSPQLGILNPSNNLVSYCIPISEGSCSLGQDQNTLSGSSVDSELC